MKNAPIALFTFKRPEHTRRALESLANNPEFLESPLFIYCDDARNETEKNAVNDTRAVVRDWPHPNKTLIERNENWGLAKSVIQGVSDLCNEFGRVIVVEDDLVVSPVFLNFLNAALIKYADDSKVMQISGYMFPIKNSKIRKANFLPITSTWGWATWGKAWKNFGPTEDKIAEIFSQPRKSQEFDLDGAYPYTRRLKQQLNGKSDSWGIQWYLSVFCVHGLVLYPPTTLVKNIGHDGSGTHCKIESDENKFPLEFDNSSIILPVEIAVSIEIYGEVKNYLRQQYGFFPRAMTWLRTEFKRHF